MVVLLGWRSFQRRKILKVLFAGLLRFVILDGVPDKLIQEFPRLIASPYFLYFDDGGDLLLILLLQVYPQECVGVDLELLLGAIDLLVDGRLVYLPQLAIPLGREHNLPTAGDTHQVVPIHQLHLLQIVDADLEFGSPHDAGLLGRQLLGFFRFELILGFALVVHSAVHLPLPRLQLQQLRVTTVRFVAFALRGAAPAGLWLTHRLEAVLGSSVGVDLLIQADEGDRKSVV